MKERRSNERSGLPAEEGDELFSDAYLKLRQRFLRLDTHAAAKGSERKGDECLREAPALTEKTVRTIWYEGRFDRRGLSTLEGQRVGVINAGEWNLDAGPDFRGAEIRLGDRTVRGDVEIHLTPRDWKAHGHDRDPAYDQVVLHVFLASPRGPVQTLSSNGNSIPSVCLAGRLPEPLTALIQNFDAEGYPYNSHCGLGACGRKMNLRKYDLVDRLLRLSGDGRILLKAQRLSFNGDGFDPEEAFYRRLLECLGYHPNKAAMAKLSEKASWSILKKILMNEDRPETRREILEAVLFGAAGLLPDPAGSWDEETALALKRLNGLWNEHRGRFPKTAEPLPWTFRRLRPANFPHRRLAGLAALLSDTLIGSSRGPSIFASFLDIGLPTQNGSSSAVPPFFIGPQGYFARRNRWGAKPFARPAALIGTDRAQAIWINAFLPVAVRVSREKKQQELERRLHDRFVSLPLREPNGPARLMAHRLLGSEKGRRFPLKRERQQQGLLQLFQDFCDTKPWACTACVFPQVLDLSLAELQNGG